MGLRVAPGQSGAAMKATAKPVMAGAFFHRATKSQRIMQMKAPYQTLAGCPMHHQAATEIGFGLIKCGVKSIVEMQGQGQLHMGAGQEANTQLGVMGGGVTRPIVSLGLLLGLLLLPPQAASAKTGMSRSNWNVLRIAICPQSLLLLTAL